MRIPVTLIDLCTLAADAPAEAAVPVLTFTAEPSARSLMLTLQSDVQAGRLVVPTGSAFLLQPRADTIEAASFEAATAAGYTIDYAALQATWAQAQPVEVAPAPVEEPALADPAPEVVAP